jgi:two-component system, NarL family, response regulator
MTAEPRIRVLCVDDHPIVREGLELIIGQQSDMEVVGSAATGEEALDVFTRSRPDVTLMDLRLPGMTGLETIRAIRQLDANARVAVLTMYQGDEDVYRALEAGAAACLFKDTLSKDLIRVVREVYAGRSPLDPHVAALLEERARKPRLTPREVEIVALVAEGLRNREIATQLGVSDETVGVHLRNIFAKLDVNDRTAAVNVSLRRGIIHLD